MTSTEQILVFIAASFVGSSLFVFFLFIFLNKRITTYFKKIETQLLSSVEEQVKVSEETYRAIGKLRDEQDKAFTYFDENQREFIKSLERNTYLEGHTNRAFGSLFYSPYHTDGLYLEIYNYIYILETKHDIFLSEPAKQMLILPLLEYNINIGSNVDNSVGLNSNPNSRDWRESLEMIIENVKDEPAEFDRNRIKQRRNVRSSISVIKAFSDKFCNIPPFCGEKRK
ncbi:hypothetical protein GCM10028803_05340 [Larkinella knui]|uniref:DUF4760 domain-containing protein n=1 Tax=Larkinella knui TaxID=2025310 RepID=A0A3P1CKP6_9BACT|nr:hypothetical protein [Larkinella knui]RRB13788.1 hypothetical protein EHT87_16145 [Larkinella knui]